MSERYYLLRNNRESGPYSLGELLQQCLLPGDLLWVEGHSQNWVAPFDLPEVQSVLPTGYSFSPTQPATFGHISDREQALRAESLRRRALAALYQQQTPLHVATPRPDMPAAAFPPLADPEDLEVVHHKPERLRGALPEFMLFCTLSALVVLGWRGGVFSHLIQVRPGSGSTALQRLDNESQHAAHALTILPQPTVPGTPLPSNAAVPAAADSVQHRDSSNRIAAATPVRRSGITRPLPRPETGAAPETTSIATQPVADATTANKNEPRRDQSNPANNATNTLAANPPAPKDKEDKPAVTSETQKVVAEADTAPKVEKHRGFLRGLFKKKKKDDAPAEEGG